MINVFIIFFALMLTAIGGNMRTKRQLQLTCSDGTVAVNGCINNACGLGYRCDVTLNYCCRQSSMPLCPDGTSAAAGCMNGGVCGPGYTCQSTMVNANLCCRSSTSFSCPNNAPTSGSCNSGGTCSSSNFICINNICCYSGCPSGTSDTGYSCAASTCAIGTCYFSRCCQPSATLICSDGSAPLAACINGVCNYAGYSCTASGICCRTSSNIKVCPNTGQLATCGCINGQCYGSRSCYYGKICC